MALLQRVPFSSSHKSWWCWKTSACKLFHFQHFAEVFLMLVPNSAPLQSCVSFHLLPSDSADPLPMPASCLWGRRWQMKQKTWVGSTRRSCFLPALLAEGKELLVHLMWGRSWELFSSSFLDLKQRLWIQACSSSLLFSRALFIHSSCFPWVYFILNSYT